MPSIEVSYLTQKAVLWPFEGVDMFNSPLRGTPVEVRVRWESRKLQKDKDEEAVVEAVVDREIAPMSLMWLGELADFYGTGSGAADAEIREVEEYSEVPDIKGRVTYRTVKLKRFRESLPLPAQEGSVSENDLEVEGSGFGFTEITTGTGTGTDDVEFSYCNLLNDTFEVALVSSATNLQIWESDPIDMGNDDWIWHVERCLPDNTLIAALENSLGVTQVTYSMSGVSWNGEDEVTLYKEAGSTDACEWPSTIIVRGV